MTTGIFSTWDYQFNTTEQALTDKIKNNPSYPFTLINDEFVFEYIHGNIWKGSLLLIASIIGTVCYMTMEFRDYNKYVGFLVFSLCMSMWLMCSGAFRRRLVIDHKKKEYCFYIHSYLHQTGPLHHIYIRIIGQKNGQGVLMYKLILNGHNLEKRELSGLSEKYQLMECQGRRIAKELNLNYFDYQDTSKHHIVVHRPNINISDTNDSSDPPV